MKTTGCLFAILVAAIAGCQSSGSRNAAVGSTQGADLAALESYDKLWLQAINTGDIEALSALTADEHITYPPNHPPVVGRVANDGVNGLTFDQYRVNDHWYPAETVVFGDWAFERGAFTSDATPKAGGQPLRFSGNYLRILRRQPDGGWKMIREMANSDQP
ncbi:MAG TPA: DUF4440 domain-containing protein [Steroidobacteraceae bacterium]